MSAAGSIVPQTEASIVSVVIIVADLNDNDPVWASIFDPVTISEVRHELLYLYSILLTLTRSVLPLYPH